jgi:urease accessory protein
MSTPTTTRTETSIAVTRRGDGGRVHVRHTAVGGPERPVIRPALVASDADRATIALVPEGALLLAGDDVRLQIQVDAGATLELIEPGGTVAYDMRGGSARWDVEIVLGVAARLVWHGQPFVASAGSDVRRDVRIVLAQSARLALRETLVLGRHGEGPGMVRQRLSAVSDGGQPLLLDGLDTGQHAVAFGGHRAMGSVLVLGADLPVSGPGTHFALESGGALVRTLAAHAHEADQRDSWRAAVAAVLG